MAKATRSSIQCCRIVLIMIWVLLAQYQIPIFSISVEPKGGGRSCIERERDALLSFKASIEDPSDVLSSWQTGQDCCRWRGVVCSNRTGHVLKLDLHNNFTYINYDYVADKMNYKFRTLGGEISPSLLAIEHLNYLNLSYNDFRHKRIPEFIGSFKNLKYLDLSDAGFGGSIPPQLGNLTKLLHLDLSSNSLESVDYVAWLPRLSSLKYLDMSEVNLSAAVDGVQAMSMLPASLRDLYLFDCNLNATFSSLPLYSSNLTSLVSLGLGDNYFHGPIPNGLLGNMTSLKQLLLGGNDLIGMVPRTLKNLCNLKKLMLWDNQISGDTAELMKRLPPKIEELYLSGNNLVGSLPNWLEHMTSLRYLDLSNNSLRGPIPSGIGKLTNLSGLDLSSNYLVGIISEDHFASLTRLEYLYLSDNSNLTMVVGPNWIPPFKLKYADLSSCKLGPHFPKWIQSQTDMFDLAMANSGIVDRLPDWFWNVISSVEYLDLSLNQISGVLPSTLEFLSAAYEINLNSNRFQGGVPQLPTSLWLLDLSNNTISGTIPLSMCNQFQSLEILDLSHNRLSGQLPQCLTSRKSFRADPGDLTPIGSELTIVSFRNNSLTGEFPLFFRGCQYINFLDLSYNKFYGSLPIWIGKRLPQLAFLLLRSNMFSGYIPIQLAKLDYLHVLDLAHNNLSGIIAPSLMNFTAMTTVSSYGSYYLSYFISLLVVTKGQALEYNPNRTILISSLDLSANYLTGKMPQEIGGLATLKNLNLSRNQLTGEIPKTIGGLQSLESLDLSNNELYGEIPSTLSNLTFLSYLNLSYNNLSGRIPSGQQLQTLDDPSIYEGNNNLCGPPISKNCSGGDGTTQSDPLEYKDEAAMTSFYLSMGLGFAVGLCVIFGPLLLKTTWRVSYFLLIDDIYDGIYINMVLSWARLIASIKKK